MHTVFGVQMLHLNNYILDIVNLQACIQLDQKALTAIIFNNNVTGFNYVEPKIVKYISKRDI